ADGREAVDMAAKSPYDVILMDIQMPVMNGYEAAAAIKKSGNAVPIIAMTANAMPEDIKRTKAAGMIDHIAKPIDLAKTLETIQTVLKN
ncbi:MAG: response regulator, partial [Selenomonadaceae bacterium]|nr:response regulator [Selenomonadaceae bacterium]